MGQRKKEKEKKPNYYFSYFRKKFFYRGNMNEKITEDINELLDGYINIQKHRWDKHANMKKYTRAEEIHKNLNLLRKIKTQINTILEE